MFQDTGYGRPRMPEKELNDFARSLYRYLYFKLNMYNNDQICSPHFSEAIGNAVLCVRKSTRDFNIRIWENCGYGVCNRFVCQKICDLYPDTDYFKKLFFMSAFILDMVWWFYERRVSMNVSPGPNLWAMMFRNNFEREFQTRGGWQGLLQAATDFQETAPEEILPREHFLPDTLECVMSTIRGLNRIPEVDEVTAALGSLQVEPMEIDTASVVEATQPTQSEEGIEKEKPSKVAQVEESKEESQPDVSEDKSGQHSSALGDNVAQTENLGEGTSGKSGAGAQRSFGGRNLRKRRHDTPPQTESDDESDSPSKSKVEKK